MKAVLVILSLALAGLTAVAPATFDQASAAPRITGLRSSSARAHTRVVLDMTAAARSASQVLSDPARVVLDVQAEIDPAAQPLEINDGLVARVRVGTNADGTARLVFDLLVSADYRISDVPRDGDRPSRIVVDFFALPGAAPAVPGNAAGAALGGPGPGGLAGGLPDPAPPPVIAHPARRDPWEIVVDPGHGGADPGAQGLGSDEKDVCLAIARQVVDELNRRPGFRAHLSRDGDYFIPLRGRMRIAEQKNADAFVSIHANASRSRDARGTEVYFLSLSGATDEASRELAHLENSADLAGGVAPEADDDLSSILFDMQQTDVLQKGSLLAESVVNSLRDYGPLLTRGVKQAGFVVLKSPRIPSILVETAFITHPQENRLLRQNSFQGSFARRVADGIVKYFQNVTAASLD